MDVIEYGPTGREMRLGTASRVEDLRGLVAAGHTVEEACERIGWTVHAAERVLRRHYPAGDSLLRQVARAASRMRYREQARKRREGQQLDAHVRLYRTVTALRRVADERLVEVQALREEGLSLEEALGELGWTARAAYSAARRREHPLTADLQRLVSRQRAAARRAAREEQA